MIFERVMAAVVLVVCVLLLLRLALGARRRARVDAVARRAYQAVRQLIISTRHRREAMRVADEAIKRARDRGSWDGNVYKPKSFRKPPRDKMH